MIGSRIFKAILFSGVLLASILTSSFASATTEVACWVKDFGKRPVVISFDEDKATFRYGNDSCDLIRVDYNPTSARYKGWIRFGDANPQDAKYHTVCTKVMSAFHAQSSTSGSNPDIDFHWISLSTEAQTQGDGLIQLGYENIWDPGAGGTAKSMMSCRPNRR